MSLPGFITKRLDQTQEPEPVGIGGFRAYATISENTEGNRVLPTSVLEDGSHANDHVIIEPLKVGLTIDIADTFVELAPASPIPDSIANVSGVINQFLPTKTQSQLNKMVEISNTIDTAMQTLDRVGDLFGMAFGGAVKTHRESFIEFLHDLYNSDAIISIETRERTYEDMSLAMFSTYNDNERQAIRVDLMFQQLTFRELQEIAVSEVQKKPSPAAAAVTGSPQEKGAQGATSGKTPTESQERSVLSSVFGR